MSNDNQETELQFCDLSFKSIAKITKRRRRVKKEWKENTIGETVVSNYLE